MEHTTPGGERRKVKVKSLPPEEQAKYRPKKEEGEKKEEDLKGKIEEKKKKLEMPSKERRQELDSVVEDVFNDIANSGSAASLGRAIKKHNLSKSEAKWMADEAMHDVRVDYKDKPDKLKKVEDEVNGILSGKKPEPPKKVPKEKPKKEEPKGEEDHVKSLTNKVLKGYPESSDINFRDDFEGKVKYMMDQREGMPPLSKRELELKMKDIAQDLVRSY